MPKPSPIRYRTTNWSDYNAAPCKRGSLSVWFDPKMIWNAGKTGKRGRPETFSDAAIQICLTLKVLFGLPDSAPPTGVRAPTFGEVQA